MTSVYNRPDGKNRFQIASASERPLFSAWLDQEFNAIYRELNGIVISQTVSANEWTDISGSYARVSTTSFSVSGNYTSVFEPLRAILFTDNVAATTLSHVQSSSYTSGTNTTTVVVYDPVVPAVISKISVGIISEESASIPSSKTVLKNANYTVGASDKIILVDDSMSYTEALVYDDGQVGGSGYAALLITLPQPSTLVNKLICVKKYAGAYKTIVCSHFTHSTSTNQDNETVHTNTYDFQILGDGAAKNRVTLDGIGDCYWLVSNGSNWYEITPNASETVKGIVRFATENEMTLTAQQIADGEHLRRDLAVSPYHADIEYLRTDASNMRFSSNYIYKAPNGVAALINNNIVVYGGLGLNIPTGRDSDGVITTKTMELENNLTFAPVEVTGKLKLMFVTSDGTLQPILASNYYMGYSAPTVTGTQTGDVIIWFDFASNLLKESTDNGANWTTFDGAGPICEFYGNGSNITNLYAYGSVGFLTRDELQNVYQQSIANIRPGYLNAVSGTAASGVDTQVSKDSIVLLRDYFSYYGTFTAYVKPSSDAAPIMVGYFSNDSGSDTWNYSSLIFVPKSWYFGVTMTGASYGNYSYDIFPLSGGKE